ncbi:MAG TPA: hypothetical protein VMT60_04005 [Candidatus Bathyarchaeia archaeon]|nr:hypothetical protein [Candidatus Bathyarchaeia archaeon]
MLVRCSLCGGENERAPGQEMLACTYCGAALALEAPRGPEHLILVHTRKDAAAENTLRSFLIENERRRPVNMMTEFAFIPFAMMEDADGKPSVVPASKSLTVRGGVPYPPAGQYRFFDESSAAGQKVISVEDAPADAVRIIHLPVYAIRYEAGKWKGSAAIVGESWQTIARELPPERPRVLNVGLLLAAAGLFAVYLVLGKIASSLLARVALIMAASGCGYVVFSLRERAARRV